MSTVIVVDTMIASAWLGTRQSDRQARWAPVLEPARWVLPFPVVAEMRFGAEVAGWGDRRRSVLESLIQRSAVIPPLESVIDAYVNLRSECSRSGHGLAAKDHEADRWIAAVSVAGNLPLATEDSIFYDVPGLPLLRP